MASDAKFSINADPFANAGFDALVGQVLTLQLEASPGLDILSVTYSVVATSPGAPTLTFSDATPSPPTTAITTTMPATGVHTFLIAATIVRSGGTDIQVRAVAIRNAGGNRKIAVSETTQYDLQFGWVEAFATLIDGLDSGGDYKSSVRAATVAALAAYTRTANVITADVNGVLAAIDGVTMVAAESMLLQDGAAGADNGIYLVTSIGSAGTKFVLTRRSDFDEDAEVTSGALIPVSEGATFGDKVRQLTTNDPIIINTTALTFSAAGGAVGGTGTDRSIVTWDAAGTGLRDNTNWQIDASDNFVGAGVNIDLDPTGTFDLAMAAAQTVSFHVADALAESFLIQQGANDYYQLDTLNASEAIFHGNVVTNPTHNFLGSGLATFSGPAAFGAAPALAGRLRLSNADLITARNAANSADINVIGTNSSNHILLGDLMSLIPAGGGVSILTGNVTWGATLTPNLAHALNAAPGATGNLFSIFAQGVGAASGAAKIGGPLLAHGGDAVGASSDNTGGAATWRGGNAQDATVTNVGGPVTIASGIGTGTGAADGALSLKVGATERFGASGAGETTHTVPTKHTFTSDVARAPIREERPGGVQTTDATVTTAATYTPESSEVVKFRVEVTMRSADDAETGSTEIVGTVKDLAGSAAIVGTNSVVHASAEDGTWGTVQGAPVIVDASGSDLRVRVEGGGGDTVNWSVLITVIRSQAT